MCDAAAVVRQKVKHLDEVLRDDRVEWRVAVLAAAAHDVRALAEREVARGGHAVVAAERVGGAVEPAVDRL